MLYLLLCSPFPNYTGGRETWAYNIASRIPNTKIVSYWNDSLPDRWDLSQEKLIQVRVLSSSRYLRPFIRSYLRLFDSLVYIIAVIRVLRNIVTKEDILVALGPIIEIWAARRLSTMSGAKCICSVRGFHARTLAENYRGLQRLLFRIERKSFEVADEIWCNGLDTLGYVKRLGFHCLLMPNGINYSYFSSIRHRVSDEVRFVVVATVSKNKGVNQVLEALRLLKERCPTKKYRVNWYGKGDAKFYTLKARAMGVSSIRFLGEYQDLRSVYENADVALNLSGGGGMSMSFLEALASGVLTITWDSPIYRSIVGDKPGVIMVKEWSGEDLANAIQRVIEEGIELHREEIKTLQKAVSIYDWDKIATLIRERMVSSA